MNNKIISHYPPGYKSPTELLYENQMLKARLTSVAAKSKLPMAVANDVTTKNQNTSNGKGSIAIYLLTGAIISLTILAIYHSTKKEDHE